MLKRCHKHAVDNDAQKFMSLFQEISYKKKVTGSMARTPPWLRKLIEAIDVTCGSEAEEGCDDDEDEDDDGIGGMDVDAVSSQPTMSPRSTQSLAVVPYGNVHRSDSMDDCRPLRLTRSLVRCLTRTESEATTPYSEPKSPKDVVEDNDMVAIENAPPSSSSVRNK